jgi:anti-sigma-K factor RskA
MQQMKPWLTDNMEGQGKMARKPKATSSADRDMLAAEYALGMLNTDARAEASRLEGTDSAFAEAVKAWKRRISANKASYAAANAPAAQPAPHDERQSAPAREAVPASSRAGFWRFMALATAVALVISLATQMRETAPAPGEMIVAALDAEGAADAGVRFIAVYDPARKAARISTLSGNPAEGRDYELWLVAGEDAPISLGILPRGDGAEVKIPQMMEARLVSGATLAVSEEPTGGSPTGTPTGPVVASGSARKV